MYITCCAFVFIKGYSANIYMRNWMMSYVQDKRLHRWIWKHKGVHLFPKFDEVFYDETWVSDNNVGSWYLVVLPHCPLQLRCFLRIFRAYDMPHLSIKTNAEVIFTKFLIADRNDGLCMLKCSCNNESPH